MSRPSMRGLNVLDAPVPADLSLAYGVDRSWANVKANIDGDMYPSDARKYHRARIGEHAGTAACSSRILINDDFPGTDPTAIPRSELRRRCFPDRTNG